MGAGLFGKTRCLLILPFYAVEHALTAVCDDVVPYRILDAWSPCVEDLPRRCDAFPWGLLCCNITASCCTSVMVKVLVLAGGADESRPTVREVATI